MKDPERDREWNMTASGRPFFPFDPRPQDIHVPDVGHMLAAQPRFRGATREPYSVGQHSVLAARRMRELHASTPADVTAGYTADECAAYGLTHDASEFVFGDTPRPHKKRPELAEAMAAERRLQSMIYTFVGLDPEKEPPLLKLIDRRLLRTEQHHLMPPPQWGERRDDVALLEPYGTALLELGIPTPDHEGGFPVWSFERTRQAWLWEFHRLEQLGILCNPHAPART